MRTRLALLPLVLLACVAQEEAPETAYRAFVRAAADHDSERVWALLSTDTRAWMNARAKAVAAAAPGVIPPSGEQLVLGNAARAARPPRSVVLVRESRDVAILEIEEEGGAKRQVELVREKGWRVRIPPPA